MKKIFVPFMSEELGVANVKAAHRVAKLFDAEIDACHMRGEAYLAFPYAIETAVIYSQKTLQSIEEVNRERAQELRSAFESAIERLNSANANNGSSHKVHAHWKELLGRPDIEFGRSARCYDLAVVTRSHSDEGNSEQSLDEHLLLTSGTPMLAVTERVKPHFEKTALIAWNGTMESSRAVTAAIPFLKQAGDVVVLTMGRLAENVPGPDDVCKYLEAYGISAEFKVVSKAHGDAEIVIEDYAREHDCGLIVMGAYSHSRLREFVLGGVTRYMLRETDLPLFLAH